VIEASFWAAPIAYRPRSCSFLTMWSYKTTAAPDWARGVGRARKKVAASALSMKSRPSSPIASVTPSITTSERWQAG
jgi:hypothetical protein